MTKMDSRVPKERLDTSMTNEVFLKIYPQLKFQELEVGSDLTFIHRFFTN